MKTFPKKQWYFPLFLFALTFLNSCSRTGMCEFGQCDPCVTDEDCEDTRCLDGRCLAPEEAHLLPLLIAAPDPLDFGRVAAEMVEQMTITVTNTGEGVAIFENVFVLNDPHFSLVSELPSEELTSGSETSFIIEFAPEAEGLHQGMLLIRSNNKDGDLMVDLIANATIPCLEVIPDDDIQFGQRRINRGPYIEEVEIRNCASVEFGEPLEIDDISFLRNENFMSSFDFSLENFYGAEILPPQESIFFFVYYDPQEFGEDEGIIRIQSNDEARDPLDFDVSGAGSNNDCPQAHAVCWPDNRANEQSSDEVNVTPLETIHCSADSSFDLDGEIVEWEWEVVERPIGSTSAIESSRQAETDFFVDLAGRYVLRLNVIDDQQVDACRPADVIINSISDEDIHIQLVWHTPGDNFEGDNNGSDVDLHLKRANSEWNSNSDCYYLNMNPNWGTLGNSSDDPSLDIDDVNGLGPENINLDNPESSVLYRVGVHYYHDNEMGASFATTRVFLDGILALELAEKRMYHNNFWEVATIDWNLHTVIPIDRLFQTTP